MHCSFQHTFFNTVFMLSGIELNSDFLFRLVVRVNRDVDQSEAALNHQFGQTVAIVQ